MSSGYFKEQHTYTRSSAYMLNRYSRKQRNTALTLAHARTVLYKSLGHPMGEPGRQTNREERRGEHPKTEKILAKPSFLAPMAPSVGYKL